MTLRALLAQVDGHWDEARRLFVELAETYPLDKVALFRAGEILFRASHPDLAVGYLERGVALDRSSVPLVVTFVDAVNDAGQADRHVANLRKLASAGTAPGVVGRGFLAAGLEKEALEPPGMSKGHLSDMWEQNVSSFTGQADRVQALAGRMLQCPDSESPSSAHGPLGKLADAGRLLEASRMAADAREGLGARWAASREGGQAWYLTLGAAERSLELLVALGRGDDANAERLLRPMGDDPLTSLRADAHPIRGELARERGDELHRLWVNANADLPSLVEAEAGAAGGGDQRREFTQVNWGPGKFARANSWGA